MTGIQGYRLLFRRGLTPMEQIDRNIAISIFNLKIFIGTQVIVALGAIWKAVHR